MGLVKKILSLKKVRPISTLYSDHLSLELAESFHLHLRNARIELDHEEFEALYAFISRAYRKWKKLGKPEIYDKEHTGKIVFLDKSSISPIPGLHNPSIANNELRIELQQWADYIHTHWKWLRLEFTVEEFLEFSEAIAEARENLKEILGDYPRRIGKFHVACPRGRVDKTYPEYYTEAKEDYQLKHPHKTHYLDKTDEQIRISKEYFDVSQNRIFLNIHDLYDVSVYHAQELRSWAVDEKGVDVPTAARYEFVDIYMQNGRKISEEEIKQTKYWNYLSRGVDEKPRDGGEIWIYSDPMKQAKRFMALIDSIYSQGYNAEEYPDVIDSFESVEELRHSETKYLDSPTMSEIDYRGRPYAGLMTVRRVKGAYSVWNGLHRLAILKYFCDKKIITNDVFPVIPLEEKESPRKLPAPLRVSNWPGVRSVRGWAYGGFRRIRRLGAQIKKLGKTGT